MKPLIYLTVILCLSGCEAERAQVASDAQAGIQAAKAAYVAGAATADVLTILSGVEARLPAVAEVNSAKWPAPAMASEAIQKVPKAYAESAPPEPPMSWLPGALAVAGGVALIGLRMAGPYIPAAGGFVEAAASMAWAVMATRNQKNADKAKDIAHAAAVELAPVLAQIQALPSGTLPPVMETQLNRPILAAALDQLATQTAKV